MSENRQMRVLSFGYYDDFSCFFLRIKNRLKENKIDSKYIHITPYLSGFLYWKFRDKSILLLNYFLILIKFREYRYLFKSSRMIDYYSELSLEKCIEYELKKSNSSSDKLKKIAIYYILFFEKIIHNYKPTVIIISGEDRLASSVLKNMCRKYNIKTLFFEQGPFSTTILDDKGVNANFSARFRCLQNTANKTSQDVRCFVNDFISRNCKNTVTRPVFYRSIDKIFTLKPFSFFLSVDIIEDNILVELWLKKIKTKFTNRHHSDSCLNVENSYLAILQVPSDANMIMHNPKYNNHFDFVKDCFNAVSPKHRLIIREHPKYKGRYEKELYEYVDNSEFIDFDYSIDPFCTASKCKGVIVMNSMFGIQCLLTAKNVFSVANSYYDQIVIYNSDTELSLKSLLSRNATRTEVDYYYFLYNLIKFYLIPGHYRHDDPDMISRCSIKIADKST